MIAVLGATGTIGSAVVEQLAGGELAAKAVVRNPGTQAVPIETVEADLLDVESLTRALIGARDLFLLTPHGPDQNKMESNAVAAAKAAGVERIVKISGSAPSLGPNGPAPTAVTHWQSEQRIERSGLKFQFLRSSFLMQNLLGVPVIAGLMPAPMGSGPIAMVDARDVAACAVALLADDAASDGAWQITGPASVTFADAARLRGARYVNVPPRLARRALKRRGASSFEIDHSIRMARYFASGADGSATADVAHLTGRPAHTLEQFFSDQSQVKGS